MPLNPSDLRHLLFAASTAAYRAGNQVMKYYGRGVSVDSKGAAHLAGDVVTVADRESQQIILEVLEDIHPDIGVLGEEEGAKESQSRFEKPYFWCIDPLDGTLPFLERVNGFAVAIALVTQAAKPVMGVCYLPAYGDMYHAVAGGGAFKNGKPIVFDPAMGAGTVTLSLNPNESIVPERYAQITAIAERIKKAPGVKKVAYQLHSGAVPKGCLLLESAPSLFVGVPRTGNEGVSIWDLAATACIIKAAGGVACDVFGAPLELNRRESTYCHHKGFILASHAALAQAAIEGFADSQHR